MEGGEEGEVGRGKMGGRREGGGMRTNVFPAIINPSYFYQGLVLARDVLTSLLVARCRLNG